MSQHSHDVSTDHDEKAWWIARPENVNTIWRGLVSVCVLLILVDLVYHANHSKHGAITVEEVIGFHAAYGFGAFVFVVLLGKELRKLIMRPEDYYAPPVEDIQHEDEHHHDDHEGDHHA